MAENETVHLFVRELTVLDYAYFDPSCGPVGGSLDVDVTFVGDLDEEGVVFDFSHAKKAVKRVIDDLCDHRLVVPKAIVKPTPDGRLEVQAPYGVDSNFVYRCPEVGLCVLETEVVDLESMRDYLEMEVMKVMPENVDLVQLNFREEALGSAPQYRYTHGLKQHYGNCQRLLHGHRNRVDVLLDGQGSIANEEKIAQMWENIHLAFPENIQSNDIRIGERQHHLDVVSIAYASGQGLFELQMPGRDVYVMPAETTVENIARHLRDCVRAWETEASRVEVFAYEGIRKGARSCN